MGIPSLAEILTFLFRSHRSTAYICCLMGFISISFVSSHEPSLLKDTLHQTTKENATLVFLCKLQNYTATNVSKGEFTWQHVRDSTGKTVVYDNNTHVPRVLVIELDVISTLLISQASAEDSGVIRCLYSYEPDSGTDIEISVDTNVCVLGRPSGLFCGYRTGVNETELICSFVGIRPIDFTLNWFDMDSMEALTETVPQNMSKNDLVIKTNENINDYMCVLESKSFSCICLTCSVLNSNISMLMYNNTCPMLQLSTTGSDSSSTIDTTLSATSTTSDVEIDTDVITKPSTTVSTSDSPEFNTFVVVIAAIAGAGAMSCIIIIMIATYTACKKCSNTIPDSKFDIQFELTEGTKLHEDRVVIRNNSNDPRLFKLDGTEKNNMPIYDKANEGDDMLNGLSNPALDSEDAVRNTCLYASIPETTEADAGHASLNIQVATPDNLTHAYDDIRETSLGGDSSSVTSSPSNPITEGREDSGVEQDISSEPQYFVLEKDNDEKPSRKYSMPIYAKPDKGEIKQEELGSIDLELGSRDGNTSTHVYNTVHECADADNISNVHTDADAKSFDSQVHENDSNEPHYFVLEKAIKEEIISNSVPIYAKPDKGEKKQDE